ncbi:hypothetical protein J7E93_11850 [Streptomyces sp. ISL-36]|uniref:hypothetical protein n=1 Tax=Streptomyces sp. ISL-36 TaxID=2819182 RepID=UPI001BE7B375|nr:hypothetical protein [Streptomyces sp. ISL-36]MBT2440789.1 hypothetical protein [Streptomyces sp. ISL-36]
MAAHAALPARRHRSTHGWGLPATLGVVYGFYAATVDRHGGPITWGQVLLGFVSAVVHAGAVHMLRARGRALPRELRAATWAALVGIALGFLVSLSHMSVLSATVLALVVAAGTFCVAFYLFYTHEDAAGRPTARTS